MDGFDNATWQALGLVLTVLGLGASGLVWVRRGPASGLRGVAWSLLPLAAGLTGVLRLGWDITDSVLEWAGRLVFSPVVWLGLVVTALSTVLFVVSGWMLRRNGADDRAPRRSKGAAAAAGPGTPSLPAERSSKAAAAPGAGDDMADIEEILRKHGIQ